MNKLPSENKYTLEELENIANLVRIAGVNEQIKAGRANRIAFNIGNDLISEAEVFLAGLRKELPDGWHSFAEQANREAHPEYREYLRLKALFESDKSS